MDGWQIALIVLGSLVVILLVAFIVVKVKNKKLNKRMTSEETQAADIQISGGVRYTKESAVTDSEGMNITHNKGDIILARNKTYRVGRQHDMLPGSYTVLSTGGNEVTFKLRISGLVKIYTHGDRIVLGEDDEITAVSSGVILR